jgi:hypothetical protein
MSLALTRHLKPKVSLLLLLAVITVQASFAQESPDWAIPYGKEFWRQISDPPRSLELSDSISRVNHSFRTNHSSSGMLARTHFYTAELAPFGIILESAGLTNETHYQTSLIALDGQPIHSGENRDWHVVGNTSQSLTEASPSILEHLEVRSSGIAVTWILSSRPPPGDLLVKGRFSGQADASWSAADPLLVDSSGFVHRILSIPSENGFDLYVPSEVLSNAAYPLAITILLHPTIEIGSDLHVFDRGFGFRTSGQIGLAEGKNVLLAVWSVNKDVYATRISKDGDILDPAGILLANYDYDATLHMDLAGVSVASNGTNFFAAWLLHTGQNWLNFPILTPYSLHCATIKENGDHSAASKIPYIPSADPPSVAVLDGKFLLTWTEPKLEPGGPYIEIQTYIPVPGSERVVGSVFDFKPTNRFFIGPDSGAQGYPASTAGTNHFYICFFQENVLVGAAVNLNAQVIRTNLIAGSRDSATQPQLLQQRLGLGTLENKHLLVWEENSGTDFDLFGSIISGAGDMIGPRLTLVAEPGHQRHPVVANNGTNHLLLWDDQGNDLFRAGTLTAIGAFTIVDHIQISAEGLPYPPAVTGMSSNYYIVWDNGAALFGGAIKDLHAPVAPEPLSIRPYQSDPAVAFNGTDYLVAWKDSRGSFDVDLYAARVSASGTVLDPLGIRVGYGNHSRPMVIAHRSEFLVPWRTNATWFISRINAAGQLVTSEPIATNLTIQSMASNGTNTLIVGWINTEIYCVELTIGDKITAREFPLGIYGTSIAVASDGSGYRFVWSDSADFRDRILTAPWSPANGLGPIAVLEQDIRRAFHFDIAGNLHGYFLGWYHFGAVKGIRIPNAGTSVNPRDVLTLANQITPDRSLRITANENNFIVLLPYLQSDSFSYRNRLLRVSASGHLVSLPDLPVDGAVSLAAGNHDTFFVVSEPPIRTPWITALFFELDPFLQVPNPVVTAGAVDISWFGPVNVPYSVEYQDQLGAPWQPLVIDHLHLQQPSTVTDSAPNSQRRFYRVSPK